MWSQKMKYVILCQGLGNIWARNAQCDISNPYLVLRKRLEDQYLQIILAMQKYQKAHI